VLYRNFHEINSKIYLIEISRSKNKLSILLFPDFSYPKEYIGEVLPIKIAVSLLKENLNLFENLIHKFSVKFNKLLIEGYHTHGLQKIPSPRRRSPELRAKTVAVESHRDS